MNLTIPRDFQQYACVRKLASHLGSQDQATLVMVRLFVELGYQVDIHGGSGVFKNSERDLFARSFKFDGVEPDALFRMLVDAEVLIQSGEDWVCPMFTVCNRHLDADHVPGVTRGRMTIAFMRRRTKVEKTSLTFIQKVPPECWKMGLAPVTPDQMRRAVMLIKTIDIAIRHPERPAELLTPGLVHAAIAVTSQYSDDKLTAICKRMYMRQSLVGFRRDTEFLLANFEDLVCRLMPDEGYVKWAAQHK